MKCMAAGCMRDTYNPLTTHDARIIRKQYDFCPEHVYKQHQYDIEQERTPAPPLNREIGLPKEEPVETPFELGLSAISDKLSTVLLQKNKAYGSSYDKSVDKYGKTVTLIRLQDKMNRLDSLYMDNVEEDDESEEDTLLDIAGYAVLELIRRRSVLNDN